MIDNNEIEKTLITDDQSDFEAVAKEPRVIVHRIYTKGQQFIVNGLPDELSKNWAPQLNMQANPRIALLESHQYEVVLTLNLSAQQSGKAIFQIQLDQAGLFTLQNVSAGHQETALYGACPNVLFPYA